MSSMAAYLLTGSCHYITAADFSCKTYNFSAALPQTASRWNSKNLKKALISRSLLRLRLMLSHNHETCVYHIRWSFNLRKFYDMVADCTNSIQLLMRMFPSTAVGHLTIGLRSRTISRQSMFVNMYSFRIFSTAGKVFILVL